MTDEATRWVQVQLFYVFLILVLPMLILPGSGITSIKSMRIQMLHFIVSGLLYYFLGAWYILKGDYKGYTVNKNIELVAMEDILS